MSENKTNLDYLQQCIYGLRESDTLMADRLGHLLDAFLSDLQNLADGWLESSSGYVQEDSIHYNQELCEAVKSLKKVAKIKP